MSENKIIKIAIPSDDGESMSDHFGRSLGFIVYYVDLTDKKVLNKEFRKRSIVENNEEHHHEHHHHEDNETSVEEARRHLDILNTIKDVDIIITAGIGPRMLSAFRSLNKQVIIGYDINPDNLVKEFMDQNLS
ncbi:hypothetical protein Calag_0691 [Caldisphaera lagunensis DSM 15908]|uniref:Dinitrogenase iron-molybdenum cofactor biosynthesis domain-containing protein n=1 Tax=Caldisphaera lagunensis (strain DSM 15908 / JCM 11604 / ANMR 0165 / IC-154) TaxID=1056495 RepID=L0A988_CALLD|nr:NifB/NifX family molybdenum-iron cluster-binding protein [Caldisphaera lagunensis]AFZ70436.1 hypothetical protein Calag_0691 [Caldisphaera lagunensis DSM 15908]